MYQYVNPELSYILVHYAFHLVHFPLIKWKPESYSPTAKYCVRRLWRLWYLELKKITHLVSKCQNPAYAAHDNYQVILYIYIYITIRRQWWKEKQLYVSSIDICFVWFHSEILIQNERQMLYMIRDKYYSILNFWIKMSTFDILLNWSMQSLLIGWRLYCCNCCL